MGAWLYSYTVLGSSRFHKRIRKLFPSMLNCSIYHSPSSKLPDGTNSSNPSSVSTELISSPSDWITIPQLFVPLTKASLPSEPTSFPLSSTMNCTRIEFALPVSVMALVSRVIACQSVVAFAFLRALSPEMRSTTIPEAKSQSSSFLASNTSLNSSVLVITVCACPDFSSSWWKKVVVSAPLGVSALTSA